MTVAHMRSVPLLCMALTVTSACSGVNPLGAKSTQAKNFHPGYQSHPVIETVTPYSGSLQGGAKLSIHGSGFLSGASVNVGGIPCKNQTYVSSELLTCVTPAHIAGAVTVEVVNPDQQLASLEPGFQYFGGANPTAGFTASAGGGVAQGAGVRLRFIAGVPGSPAILAGAGVRARVGGGGGGVKPPGAP